MNCWKRLVGWRSSMVVWLLPVAILSAAEIRIVPPVDPAGDATAIIAAAVERAIAEGASRLVLAPGTYHLRPFQARERFVWISNHDSGLRRTAFPIWGAKHLEIEGNGARLVLEGQAMVAFMVYDSEQVSIRNLSIDWNRPLNAQGTVVAVNRDDDSFEAEFLPECQAHVLNGQLVHGSETAAEAGRAAWQLRPNDAWRQDLQWTYWIDPLKKWALSPAQQLPFFPWNERLKCAAEVTEVGPNHFRFRHALPALPVLGSVFATKGMLGPNRLTPAIHIAGSHQVIIEDVTVHHAGGMGLIAESSRDLTLRRYQVRLPSGPRLVTTTADGSHFNLCAGQILVEDCYFENMLDDAINVHGVYASVMAVTADDQVRVKLSHFQQLGLDFARPGEKLRFCRQENLLPYGERTVRAVHRINESQMEISFMESVRDLVLPQSVMDNASRQPDVVFRRNTVRNNRGRGILVTSGGHVIIEDNVFDHPGGGMLGVTVLVNSDVDFWCESGAVKDMTIRRNTFVPLNDWSSVIKIGPKQHGVTEVQPPYHRNITVENNVFQVVGPALLDAYRIEGLNFIGNQVTAADPRREMSRLPAFVLRAAANVTIAHNRIDLSPPVTIEQATPTPGLVVEDNTGVQEK